MEALETFRPFLEGSFGKIDAGFENRGLFVDIEMKLRKNFGRTNRCCGEDTGVV